MVSDTVVTVVPVVSDAGDYQSEGAVRGDEEGICGDDVQIHGSGVNCDEKRICGDGDHGKRTSSSILSSYLPLLIPISRKQETNRFCCLKREW